MNVLGSSSVNKNFTRASEVVIPDIYNRRFKTGKESLDFLFGGSGFLPGFTFTLAAAPGTGKTSLLLQMLELLEKTGKKTAYISGEEMIEQLAFASKRLSVSQVPLANITSIEEIEEVLRSESLDFVVLDSFPALTTSFKGSRVQKEEHIVSRLIKVAKETETVIGTILHFTKGGTYKGTTLLPHSCDATIIMKRSEEDWNLRDLEVTKNRFGSAGMVSFRMTEFGFTFEAEETEESNKSSSKPKKKASKSDLVLGALSTPKTMAEIAQETEVTGQYLSSILRQGILEGKISKEGKGTSATYVEVSEEKE
jgi:DNA repair protein RadA/Sms